MQVREYKFSQRLSGLFWYIIQWIAIHLLLIRPSQVRKNLALITQSTPTLQVPTEWQVAVGVMRMWYRILFRSHTIGVSQKHLPRSNIWAHILQYRLIRFPFVLWEGAVSPWDLSGLTSSPNRLMRHVIGTHHEGEQFVYDLEILFYYQNTLPLLTQKVNAIVLGTDSRSEWLQNLVVYEGYHKTLLSYLDQLESLDWQINLSSEAKISIDTSFYATLQWCAQQPLTLRATWTAWRQGTLHLDQVYLVDESEP